MAIIIFGGEDAKKCSPWVSFREKKNVTEQTKKKETNGTPRKTAGKIDFLRGNLPATWKDWRKTKPNHNFSPEESSPTFRVCVWFFFRKKKRTLLCNIRRPLVLRENIQYQQSFYGESSGGVFFKMILDSFLCSCKLDEQMLYTLKTRILRRILLLKIVIF